MEFGGCANVSSYSWKLRGIPTVNLLPLRIRQPRRSSGSNMSSNKRYKPSKTVIRLQLTPFLHSLCSSSPPPPPPDAARSYGNYEAVSERMKSMQSKIDQLEAENAKLNQEKHASDTDHAEILDEVSSQLAIFKEAVIKLQEEKQKLEQELVRKQAVIEVTNQAVKEYLVLDE